MKRKRKIENEEGEEKDEEMGNEEENEEVDEKVEIDVVSVDVDRIQIPRTREVCMTPQLQRSRANFRRCTGDRNCFYEALGCMNHQLQFNVRMDICHFIVAATDQQLSTIGGSNGYSVSEIENLTHSICTSGSWGQPVPVHWALHQPDWSNQPLIPSDQSG